MTALLTVLLLLAGPFVTLGVWLWLRSRRAPVALAEPLDIGRVLGDTFGVFRPDNWPIPALALLLIGVPTLVWQIAFQPAMQNQMLIRNRAMLQQSAAHVRPDPFAAFAALFTPGAVAAYLAIFILLTVFYVVATQIMVGRFERRPIAPIDALKATPLLVVPALLVALLAYLGVVAGMMVFLVPGFVLAMSWCIVIPVLVTERTGMFRCFGRSRALTIGSRGRILVLGLLILVLGFALAVPGGAMTGIFSGVRGVRPSAIGIATQVIVGAISGSIHAAFFAALYVELKRIREGLAMPELVAVFA